MSVSAPAERRGFRRLTLPLPARFRLRGSAVVRHGTIKNISRAGAALLTPVPLPPEAIVEQLRFALPPGASHEGARAAIAAQVVTSAVQEFSDSSERYRAGLVFRGEENQPLHEIYELLDRELGPFQ